MFINSKQLQGEEDSESDQEGQIKIFKAKVKPQNGTQKVIDSPEKPITEAENKSSS